MTSGGGAARQAVPVDWNAAWAEALDDLELDVDRAEELLGAIHAGRSLTDTVAALSRSWSPPSSLPPLPATLRERASGLLARQLEVGAALACAAVLTRRQAEVAGKVRGREERARPMYVDACA